MSRAVPVATGFLVGVCVFAWLAGPVLEARFGAEALLAAYGAVAAGTAATTYVLIRRLDARLAGGATSSTGSATDDGRRAPGDDETGTADVDGKTGSSDAGDAMAVRLDDLDDLDVEREVRQLKAEGSDGGEERTGN